MRKQLQLGARQLARQNTTYEFDQCLGFNRFGDVLVSLVANGLQESFGSIVRSHHHDFGPHGLITQPRQQFQPRHARHPDVEQHQVERLRFQTSERVGAILSRGD